MTVFLLTVVVIGSLTLLAAAMVRIASLNRKIRNAGVEKNRLFRRSSEFLLVLDDNLAILDVSRSVLQRLHMDLSDVVGRHIDTTALWPETTAGQKASLHAMRKALNGEPSIFKYGRNEFGNRIFNLEIKVFPVPAAAGNRRNIFLVGRDITAELETKQRLSRRVAVEDIIAEISSAALAASELKECLPDIIKSSGEFLGARRAFFLQTDRNRTILWGTIWNAPGTADLNAELAGQSIEAMMPFGIETEFVLIRNIPENPKIPDAERRRAKESGVGSLILNSMKDMSGEVFGYAGFTFHQTDPPDDESSALLLKMLSTTLTGLVTKIESRKELELFRQSIDAAGQGIALINEDGLMVYANTAYSELSGIGSDSDEPVWNSYSGSSGRKVEHLILPLLRTGESWTGELQKGRSDGSTVDTIESFHPIFTGDGRPQYIVNIITDITDRKRLESELISARLKADQANRAKSNYLANMSHEIRTPMNAVIGLTYLALQTPLNTRQHDYLTKINSSAKSLLAIINDILDLSKIESGRLELELAEFSLDEVLDNLADMLVDKAREKGLKLFFTRSSDVPDTRLGDRFRLSQVLLNLLGNAVKFTESGSVELRIESGIPGYITIVVEDSGIGMTDNQINGLFTPFTQAEISTSRKFGGTGLGLTISKQIVELMNGRIEVESHPGRGSRFIVSVKMDTGPETAESPIIGESIIIVSGDSRSGWFHRQIFQPAYSGVTFCSGIKEALEHPGVPSILVYDLDTCSNEPGKAIHALCEGTGDGFTLILSGSRSTPELSVFAPPGIKTVCLSIPYSRTRLLNSLKSPDTKVPEKRSGSLTIRGRILLADDNEINRQVGKELIGGAGVTVDLAANGLEAAEACENIPYDMVFMDLHMPGMNGYEAVSRIRRNHPELPIIALTASALTEVRTRIREAGFTGYIAKPINPDELYRLIGKVLAVPVSAVLAGNNRMDSDIPEFPDIPGLIVENGLRGVLGDRQKYQEILQHFCFEHRDYVSRIRTALDDENLSEAVSLVHFLKGSAGQIGAEHLRTLSGDIEEILRAGDLPDKRHLLSLFSITESLIEDIESYSGITSRPGISGLLNELEDMIRTGERRSIDFLEEQFSHPAGTSETEYVKKIRDALSRWDFDLALEAVEDWRASNGDLIE